MMQLFIGLDSGYYAGYPMRSKLQVPEAYKDHICKIGAPIGIMSNNTKAQLHGRTKDLMCLYKIKDGQSEPEYQHQNPAEWGVQNLKRNMNDVMDHTGYPGKWWLLAALFMIALMDHLPNTKQEIPITKVTG